MINNLEIEYKILVTKAQFEKLSAMYPNKKFILQINTYYDTKNQDLKKQKCAMRIREKENRFLITLKTPSEKGHHEFECYVSENSSDAIKQSEIYQILDQLNIHDELISIGTCVTDRAVIELEKAELCFDINYYNSITDYEIEYEQTIDHDGIKEFNQILSKIQLVYENNCPSKIKRTLESK